jgi:hypothetical protein
VTLTVLERKGDQFKALYEIPKHLRTPKHSREISGTVKNGSIEWFAKDVKVLEGHEGQDTSGTIKDNTILLRYTGVTKTTGENVTGEISLQLSGAR